MNLPNKLTMLRMLMIPLFLAAFFLAYSGIWQGGALCSFLLFVAAAYTDHLDGTIARKRGLVTDFGKLMDPLADKVLVMAAMICLMVLGAVHPLVVIVVLSREFLVTSIRTVGAGKGVVIAADLWGKTKTVAQMVWLSLGLLSWTLLPFVSAGTVSVLDGIFLVLTVLVLALTILSGVNYTVKNRDLFRDA